MHQIHVDIVKSVSRKRNQAQKSNNNSKLGVLFFFLVKNDSKKRGFQ